MKFKINKEYFATGLRQVSGVVNPRPPMPVLYNVLVKAEDGKVTLATTNIDLAIKCAVKAEVEVPGDITLPVRKLAQLVEEMPQQEITLESRDGRTARVRSGRANFSLNGMEAENFPPLPSSDDQHNYELGSQELMSMLHSVSYAQSTDESRYILNGVYFNFSEGKLSLVATDARRVAIVSRDMKIDHDEEGHVILPAKTVSELEKLLSQGKSVKIGFNDRQATFDIALGKESEDKGLSGSIYLVSKTVEGIYPDYKQVVPKEAGQRIKIERELMLDAVRRMRIVVSSEPKCVRLKIADNILEISAQSPEVGEAKESIDVEYSGPEIQLGFNPDFLFGPLDNVAKDEIYFEFKDAIGPGVFKTLDGKFLCVVMPIRI